MRMENTETWLDVDIDYDMCSDDLTYFKYLWLLRHLSERLPILMENMVTWQDVESQSATWQHYHRDDRRMGLHLQPFERYRLNRYKLLSFTVLLDVWQDWEFTRWLNHFEYLPEAKSLSFYDKSSKLPDSVSRYSATGSLCGSDRWICIIELIHWLFRWIKANQNLGVCTPVLAIWSILKWLFVRFIASLGIFIN